MDKRVEKKIEKELGKKIVKDIQKEIDKQVEKEVEKKVDDVEKEVEKRVESFEKSIKKEVEKSLGIKFYNNAKKSAGKFKIEFKKQTVIAISAALGFLIALSWRTPIQNLINRIIDKMGLVGGAIYIEFAGALVITFLGVLCLIWLSQWNS